MKKYLHLLFYVLVIHLSPGSAYAADIFQQYAKVIWIDQEQQVGAAYSQGRKLLEFPLLSGDDETPTPPGTYVVKLKDPHYYSRKYKVPMPYSLFFDLKGMRAIHEGDIPDPEEQSEWATHGCIHVEQPYMKWLYDWAEQGKTVVVIRGRRVWEDKKAGEGAGQIEERPVEPEWQEENEESGNKVIIY